MSYGTFFFSVIFCCTLCTHHVAHAQQNITWEDLSDVIWSEEQDSTGLTIITGAFGDHLSNFNGQEVYISGYVIPLDAMGFSYALSRTNYASCFFCGQAGPETVMDLNIKPRSIPSYEQNNKLIKFKGTLILYEQNKTGLNYVLDKAERVN